VKPVIVTGIYLGALLGLSALLAATVGPRAAVLLVCGVSALGAGLGLVEWHLRRKARS